MPNDQGAAMKAATDLMRGWAICTDGMVEGVASLLLRERRGATIKALEWAVSNRRLNADIEAEIARLKAEAQDV